MTKYIVRAIQTRVATFVGVYEVEAESLAMAKFKILRREVEATDEWQTDETPPAFIDIKNWEFKMELTDEELKKIGEDDD